MEVRQINTERGLDRNRLQASRLPLDASQDYKIGR